MTIRRNIDLSDMSGHLRLLEEACDNAPDGFFPTLKTAIAFVGEQCDNFIKDARSESLGVCNCDGIREIESLMFNMLLRNATIGLDDEIKCAQFFGTALQTRNFDEQSELVAHVQRNAGLIKTLTDWEIVVAECRIDDDAVVDDSEERFAGSDAPFVGTDA